MEQIKYLISKVERNKKKMYVFQVTRFESFECVNKLLFIYNFYKRFFSRINVGKHHRFKVYGKVKFYYFYLIEKRVFIPE